MSGSVWLFHESRCTSLESFGPFGKSHARHANHVDRAESDFELGSS